MQAVATRPLKELAVVKGLVGGPFGSNLGKADYTESGVPVIRGQNLSGTGFFSPRDFVYVSEDKANGDLSRNLALPNDVVFTQRGTLGQVGIIPSEPYERYVISQSQMRLRVDSSRADARYVYYCFRDPAMVARIHARAITTGVPHINLGILAELPIPEHPLPVQNAIAEVLGALDDKIAINERITATTADLCLALMQDLWKQGGVSSLTVGHALQNPDWTRTTLGELCAAGGGAIQTGPFGSQLHASDYVETGIPSVMPVNIGDNVIAEDGIARITAADAARLSKYLLAEGDIVYSRRGDVKRRALVRRQESGWLCGTGCLRVRAGSSVEPLFLSHYLGQPEVQNWIQRHAVGATMPNLNTSILGAVPVVLPARNLRARIDAEFSALDARSTAAIGENMTLVDLRNTLIPQLITGNIRVKDAVRVVEDVAS